MGNYWVMGELVRLILKNWHELGLIDEHKYNHDAEYHAQVWKMVHSAAWTVIDFSDHDKEILRGREGSESQFMPYDYDFSKLPTM